MALSTDQYFTNSIVGQMMAGADVSIYRVDTSPKYPIGQGFQRADGSIFRYASFDAAVLPGRLVAPVFANAGLTVDDNHVINPASAVQVAAEYPILPGQVGSHYLEVTLGSIAAGKYEGGYLVVNNGSGRNYTYRILGNTATNDPATGNIRIQLYEPLQALLSSNTDIIIVPSLFNDVDVASAATNWSVAGATVASMTSGSYGWICTWGEHGVLQDGAWTGGDQLALSTAVNGAAAVYGAATTNVASLTGVQIVGYAIQNGGDTEAGAMYLQIGK